MHTVLCVAESSINGSLYSERISRQQQDPCELEIDHCEHALGAPNELFCKIAVPQRVFCWEN